MLYIGISLLSLVVLLLYGHGFLLGSKIGMMVRIIMTGAIYQKVLSMSQATVGRLSIGHIINLASNDVQRFDLVRHELSYNCTLHCMVVYFYRCLPTFIPFG